MASKSLGVLTLDLIARIGGYEQGMDKAARVSKKRTDQMAKDAQTLGSIIGKTFGVIAGGFAFNAVVQATTESEEAMAQLEARIKSTGGVAGVGAADIAAFASELQSLTTFEDDAIIKMESLLLSFTNLRGGTIKDATVAILDLSTALGIDLDTAAKQVGKALNDPIKGMASLAKIGIQFNDQQKDMIKGLVETGRVAEAQGIIIKELETLFGGAATAAADTFGGALKQAQNAFGNLLEADGGLNDGKESLRDLTALLQDPQTVAAAKTLTNTMIEGFTGVAKAITETVNLTRFLGEEIAARIGGPALDDMVRVAEKIERLEAARDKGRLKRTASAWISPVLSAQAISDGTAFASDADIDKEISRLKKSLETHYKDFPQPVITPKVDTSKVVGALVPSESEEFTKLRDKLQEQVTLYGSIGEAAKIRYQIESGALDELSGAEQKQLLMLAEEYDKRVDVKKATEAQAQAHKQLLSQYDQMESSLQRQIALFGDQSEFAAMAYDLEHGSLRDLDSLHKDRLLALQNELSVMEQMKAAQESTKADSLTAIQDYNSSEGDRLSKELGASTDAMTVFADQAARNMQSSFADYLFDPFEEGADGMLQGFGKMLRRMVAEAAAAQIFDSIFGKAGAGGARSGGMDFAGMATSAMGFFGFKDSGGSVPAGGWAIAGEKGPEIVRGPANVTSRIDTAKMMRGGSSVSIGNMSFPGVTNEREARRAAGAAAREISRVVTGSARYA